MPDEMSLNISQSSSPFILSVGPTLSGVVSLTGPASMKGLSSFVAGNPEDNEIIIANIAPYSYTITVEGSNAVALNAASADVVFTIKRTADNITTEIGTVTFAAGVGTGVVTIADGNITKGSLVTVHAPTVQDASLSGIAFLLAE